MQFLFKIIKSAPVRDEGQLLSLRQIDQPVPQNPLEEEELSPEELISLARREAEQLVDAARKQAEQIMKEAQKEAELQGHSIKEQARQQGWQEGIDSSEAEADQIREQARQVLGQAWEIHRQTIDKMEGEVVDLALAIARRVVMAQLSVEPGTVMEIVREAVESVKNRPLVNIYVSEMDLEIIEKDKNKLLQGLPGKVELNILADAKVQPGGCRIETDQGQVDATMETRWREMIKSLYGLEE
ncbi:FliH/SctL family protein [Desulforamulus aquiferis]|uniref:FliH/SctL family protein n=1 Tax=Desulforamulus aquiferis TaxID=1397668 RepID=A0AAW7ZG75_9FIRM|nr:FliH/SctL family protein [Desulforamulus aquiferis]MDO7788367.1 FliH/SctL family protein [Desulforamulus aquiferis]